MTTAATNLASRAGTPNVFALAIENGGLLQDTNGSVMTFRGNADGLLRLLADDPVYCLGCLSQNGLRNLNFSVSFDLDRDSSETVPTAGPATEGTPALPFVQFPRSSRALSSFTARYDIYYNPRDVRSKEFQDAWKAWFARKQPELQKPALALLGAIGPQFLDVITEDPRYQDWRKHFNADLQTATAGNIVDLTREYMDEVVRIVRVILPDFDEKVRQAQQAYARFALFYEEAIRELNKAQFTAEYTFSRPRNQPELHNARLVYGFNPRGGRGLFSANLASTFYAEVPRNARYGRVRDVQAAAQFDRPLGNLVTHPAVLTLAGYYQYQFEPAVLQIGQGNLAPGTNIQLPGDAAVLLGPKGHMGVLQAKVTLKVGDTGIRIPLAVTWSNRTELLKANDVRGQIGLTYDFSSLFTR